MNFSSDLSTEEDSVAIDLTSLIDVLFVLLLFFMVATTFTDVRSVSVNLPSASAQAVQPVKKDLSVTVAIDGTVSLTGPGPKDERKVALTELRPLLAELAQPREAPATTAGSPGAPIPTELSLVVNADTKVEHGSVVAVLDAAKSAGIKKIAIATKAPVGQE